ncbi:hypothetical protein BDA96_01G178400 [Sorghum bicolor]|uniref:Uncharacterized protein n=1 Tax=Sorghum bicolor TaxID=4558 RepID=A0A921V0H0_SORBI|nr:hypothetical protein BDA96_01G178400 [Sorghum bicolor]
MPARSASHPRSHASHLRANHHAITAPPSQSFARLRPAHTPHPPAAKSSTTSIRGSPSCTISSRPARPLSPMAVKVPPQYPSGSDARGLVSVPPNAHRRLDLQHPSIPLCFDDAAAACPHQSLLPRSGRRH